MAEKSQHTIPAVPARPRAEVETIIRPGGEVYSATLALQEQLYEANLAAKAAGRDTHNTLILCEHPPTYTLGKSGDPGNMLFRPEAVGAAFHQINRGGDITYHGPGQLVVYPIFDLDTLQMGPAAFVAALEETIMLLLSDYGLTATRLDGAPGIWLDAQSAPRKICAIGMKISRGCIMHGIALNINTDLKYFGYIVPCGLPDKAVTSIQQELGKEMPFEEVRDRFLIRLQECLSWYSTRYLRQDY